MALRHIIICICLLLTGASLEAHQLLIRSQEDFDRMDQEIHQRMAAGEYHIDVQFLPGDYYYRDNHLRFEGMDCAELSLALNGNGARLIGQGPDYRLMRKGREYIASYKEPFDYTHGFVDPDSGRNFDFRTPVRQAKKRPEVVDRESGLCRMQTGEAPLSEADAADAWILLTQWFRGMVYKVVKIERGYVYFHSDHAGDKSTAAFDIDADYHFGKSRPRYILFNQKTGASPYIRKGEIHLRQKVQRLHECVSSRFLLISGSRLGHFSMNGFSFLGNGGKDELMKIYRSESAEFTIRNCVFDSIRSDVVVAYFSPHLSFTGNVLRRTYRNGVVVGYGTDDSEISGNRFYDTGVLPDNVVCVRNMASRTHIADNLFEDFSYGAIISGIHYTETMSSSCSAVIERNEVYQTAAFRRSRRMLMDSGAIYTTTISQGQVIRNNYVHDIDGPCGNRGIFLDDGAVCLEIYDNLVLRIANDYCIDSRRVSKYFSIV